MLGFYNYTNMKGRILIINPGSTSTKIGFYEDGQ